MRREIYWQKKGQKEQFWDILGCKKKLKEKIEKENGDQYVSNMDCTDADKLVLVDWPVVIDLGALTRSVVIDSWQVPQAAEVWLWPKKHGQMW